MADRKTSEEEAAAALTGDELLRIVQDGASRRTTIQQIVVLAAGGEGSGGGGIPSTLSGAQTAILTETLGILVSDSDGTTTLQLTKNIDGLVAVADGNIALTAAEINVYTPGHDVRLHVGANLRLGASNGVYITAAGAHGVHIVATSGALELSGPQATLSAETLGIALSNGGGSSKAIEFTLYGGNNIIADAPGANVYLKVGGNFAVSAPATLKLQGASGVQIVSASGPISLTPSNASQAIHLQNRVSADDWPTADPATSGHLWLDGNSVRVSDGSGDPVITTKGALLQAISTQSIGNVTWTSAQFTAGDGNPALDEDGFYDSGSNTRLTMPRDGWYVVTSWHTWAGDNNGQRYARLLLNGTTSLTQDSRIVSAAGNDPNVVMAIVHKFAAGDYVELQVWQSSGGSLNLAGAILRIAPLP